ncbi:MAG: SCO family protein [Gammaproteobacteria bacterium]|nr:SCO family protein [Gammaproteobacteria bacterium]
MKKNLLPMIAVLALTLGVASAVWLLRPQPIQLQAATWLGEQAKPLPTFALTDHNNQAFTNDSIRDKWHLLFFGYTHCPDICPDTMQTMANMLQQIDNPQLQEKLQLVFVSVDPERDDLERMKTYVTYFHPDILSASADINEVTRLTDALGIHHRINRIGDEQDYLVEHSGALVLLTPQAHFGGVFMAPHDSGKIAHDLTALIQG